MQPRYNIVLIISGTASTLSVSDVEETTEAEFTDGELVINKKDGILNCKSLLSILGKRVCITIYSKKVIGWEKSY
jgi:hypothetical protein